MDTLQLAQLKDRFAIPGIAEVVAGNGGLPKIHVSLPSSSADIYLHGAQVTSWQPAGQADVIFLSAASKWEAGRAIRGGIPICFPWFRSKADNPNAPSHGFVRTKAWELVSITHAAGEVTITLATQSDETTRKWWPQDFYLEHRITAGRQLKLELVMKNTGEAPLRFEEALHTYHRVGDIQQVSVAGLEGAAYQDNTDGNREKTQQGEVTMSRATDSAYLGTRSALKVIDPVLGRSIRIEKGGSESTVVWNPWEEGAKSLTDLGDAEWRTMACVEASNIRSNAVNLGAGETHTLTATLTATMAATITGHPA